MRHHVPVSKIDENSRDVVVDEQARRRLADALDRPEVIAVYVFGSQATGRAGPLSDADVAVLLHDSISAERRGDLHLDLIGAAVGALGTNEVDLVLLRQAPPLLRHRVLRDGILILDRAPRERLRFQVRALNEYFDTAPLRAELARGLCNRLAEGTYGRR